jgi:hypothetical protein
MQTHSLTRRGLGSLRLAGIFLFAALFFPTGNAQTAGTGSIQGAVADQTGAVLQNASVTILNAATAVQHKTTTGSDGLYSFPNIPIGVYNLDVSAPGFEHYSQAGIDLEVGSRTGLPCRRKTLRSSRPLTRRRSRNCL